MAVNILDSRSLLTGLGALGVFLVLFAETGLLIGFFLPGDSLLFTAGVLAATGTLSGGSSLVTLILAAAADASWPGGARSLSTTGTLRVGQQKVMESGFGTGRDLPVSVSFPDRRSTPKTLTPLLASLATSSHRPLG
jgi:hypothetical protein